MTQFYEMMRKSTGDASGVADDLGHDRRFVHVLNTPGFISDPPELSWSWASEHPPGDLVWTVDMIRLVSPRIREVFDRHLGPNDQIQWLPGKVLMADGRTLAHWVPHFPIRHDVLDQEQTTWGPSGLPIRWVLSRTKLDGHAVFALPEDVVSVIVTREVLEDLQALGVTGYTASPARIV